MNAVDTIHERNSNERPSFKWGTNTSASEGSQGWREGNKGGKKDVDSALMTTMRRMLPRSAILMAGPIVKSYYFSRF